MCSRARRRRRGAYALVTEHAQAAGADSEFVYSGGKRRWFVDRGPARGPRARVVRTRFEAASGAESREPALVDADRAGVVSRTAGSVRRDLRRVAAQRIRSRTLWRAQRGRQGGSRGSGSIGGREYAAGIARPVFPRRAVVESGKNSRPH